jgi:hypothetical protein
MKHIYRFPTVAMDIKPLVVLVLASFLVGCAIAPKTTREYEATYVSPLKYKDYTCARIAVEVPPRVQKASELRYKLDRDTGDDDYGLLLFLIFPMAMFQTNLGDPAAQYSQIKAELEALKQVAIQKDCSFKVQTD